METSINLSQITNITNATKATRQTAHTEVREAIADETIYVETTEEASEGDHEALEAVIHVRRNAISVVS